MRSTQTRGSRHPDRGAILIVVLVVSVVLALVVVGVARYGTASLRFSGVTEDRSDQLAAADAAMSYAVNLLEIRAAECIYNEQTISLPPLAESFNGATGSVQCSLTGGGLDSASLFALVLTGEGVPSTEYLVETSGGSVKEITGPIFMERADPDAFDLSNNNGIRLNGAPLVHYDGTLPECDPVSEDPSAPGGLSDDVGFVPDEIFGPICTGQHWDDYGPTGTTFDEPPKGTDFAPVWVSPTLGTGGTMRVFDGGKSSTDGTPNLTVPLTGPGDDRVVTVEPSYTDVAGPLGTCRVFEPGRYVSPPDTDGYSAYFKSGDYLFDFRTALPLATAGFDTWTRATLPQSVFEMNHTVATAGKPDPDPDGNPGTPDGFTQQIENPDCDAAIAADGGGYGATFYFSGRTHLALDTQAVIEIMPRNKGTASEPLYVSIHAICDAATSASWCTSTPAGVVPSDRFAPASDPGDPALVWIKAGQVSEIVANGLVYAPQGELYFKNVANNAEVRLLGGAVVARATVDAAASASNLEIGVANQDVDLDLRLVATGTDANGGETQIVSDVDLQYDADDLDDRLDIRSWRVCEISGC